MSVRHFGLSRREAVGGNQPPGALLRADTPREYINRYFPSGSILAEPASPPFERGKISQALIDVGAIGFLALVVFALASAIGIFGYVAYLKFFI